MLQKVTLPNKSKSFEHTHGRDILWAQGSLDPIQTHRFEVICRRLGPGYVLTGH